MQYLDEMIWRGFANDPGSIGEGGSVAMGVSEETVAVHDRNLVVAGLRTKGGRGTSAAKVTPRDAARLFVAVLVQ